MHGMGFCAEHGGGNSVKLKTKLIIGFASFMIILAGLGLISYVRMSGMQTEIERFYNERFVKVKAASGARDDSNNMARELVNELLNGGTSTQEAALEIQRYKKRVIQALQLLENTVLTIQEKENISQVNRSWANYIEFVEEAERLSASNNVAKANELRNSVGLPYLKKLQEDLNSLASYHEMMMDDQLRKSQQMYELSIAWTVGMMGLGILLSIGVMVWVIPGVTRNLNTMALMIRSLSRGRTAIIRKMKAYTNDEIGEVIEVFKSMVSDLEQRKKIEEQFQLEQEQQAWIDSNIAKVTDLLNGVTTLQQVGQTFINEFTPILSAQYGALYIRDEARASNKLRLYGTYAAQHQLEAEHSFDIGEGLVGQCAADERPILIHDMVDCSLRIQSGVCEASPMELALYPITFEQRVLGVVELASLKPLTHTQHKLLEQLMINLGVIIHTISGKMRVEDLLRDSQALTEELQCQSEELMTQQEDLRRSNEHLEAQTEALKRSEELLQRQQEELEHYNTELIAKTRALEETMLSTQEKNEELESARTALERQTLQLALASKYKSEFLANMSHELRTPLNSLLVLSQLLGENKEGNLLEKQVEYARTIHMSGADLLKMIDEILDLSKIDAGKMKVDYELMHIQEITSFMYDSFEPIASQKGIAFQLHVAEGLPASIYTDADRLKQIVRNLLSNAFKFTNSGSIELALAPSLDPNAIEGEESPAFLAIQVKDTGIGIPQEKLGLIFDAFQQLDGTTSRKYGGAGLGLSISRELTQLLGGSLTVSSIPGQGSTFTLLLPMYTEAEELAKLQVTADSIHMSEIEQLVREVSKQIEDGVSEEKESVKLQQTQMLSEVAASYAKKKDNSAGKPKLAQVRPWMFERRRLLIVEDDGPQRQSMIALIEGANVSVTAVSTGSEALEHLAQEKIDGMVLDLMLPDMTGFQLMERIEQTLPELVHLPIIIYTGKSLDNKEELELRKRAQSIIIKNVKSPERLLQETMLLLNRVELEEDRSYPSERALEPKDQLLSGKRVLLVDDDVRNVFALSSVLEQFDMVIEYAENGVEALAALERKPTFDIVLMDMMMPEMDGYEAMRKIRQMPAFEKLPIIALTAKAMKEDRNKCIEAGASDYVSKPFQTEQLLSLMRVWLYST